jgi:hypothetical protein
VKYSNTYFNIYYFPFILDNSYNIIDINNVEFGYPQNHYYLHQKLNTSSSFIGISFPMQFKNKLNDAYTSQSQQTIESVTMMIKLLYYLSNVPGFTSEFNKIG